MNTIRAATNNVVTQTIETNQTFHVEKMYAV